MNRKLTLKRRGKSDALREEEVPTDSIVTVGNNPGSTILLDEKNIAPEQFLMLLEGDEFVLMNRAEGTICNGNALSAGARVALSDGDLVEVGSYELLYVESAAKRETKAEPESSAPLHGNQNAATGTATARETKATTGPAGVNETDLAESRSSDSENDRDFSELLYNLREEDTFYFHLHDNEGSIERVPFEIDEIWLGTRLGNVAVDTVEENIDEVFARVNKDWSGVVIYPRDDQKLLYNGENLVEPVRLSDGDELVLIDDFEEVEHETRISFHEPVALIALSTILPGELPEPVSSESSQSEPSDGIQNEGVYAGQGAALQDPNRRLMFGYFTLIEVLIMAVGTIVTAAIIFFVLEFV